MRIPGLTLAAVALCSAATVGSQPNIQEIVERSAAAMEANWKAAPNYAYTERDVESKRGGSKTVKTYRVIMLEGSQYNRLIEVNDRPLSKQEDLREEQKLQREIERRKRESPEARAKRVARYERERRQDHVMMKEMTRAFDFKSAGETNLNGREVWILDATPKPGYQPINREAKVLTGMKGRLWIDKQHYQWAKVSAEVTHPIAMYLVAKVSPGTRFELEQEPVADGIWLPKHFTTIVNATALGFLNENSTDDETYRDYKPMQAEVELVTAGKPVTSN